jgi:hypothetical protein
MGCQTKLPSNEASCWKYKQELTKLEVARAMKILMGSITKSPLKA